MISEREFLHDISSPLAAALLNTENALSIFKNNSLEETTGLELLNKALKQLNKTSEMIHARQRLIRELKGNEGA